MEVQQLLDLLDRIRAGVARARYSFTLQLKHFTSKYALSSETDTNMFNHPLLAIPSDMVAVKQVQVTRKALLLPFVSLTKLSIP